MARRTCAELRREALEYARGQLRRLGENPEKASAEDAARVVDELAFCKPQSPIAKWWLASSENQYKLFCREWRAWCRERANWRSIERRLAK